MLQKRSWTKEEKIAIIKECEQSPTVVEVLRKYNLAQSMVYKWRRQYEAYGDAAFDNKHYRSDPEIKRVEIENQRLKKLLAEKELQNEFLKECLKKRNRN